MNFTWWVNRKDRAGNNCFEGGFLGLDNIGVFDRSAPLPTGGYLDQADGTAWMVFFSQQMLRIAVELALQDPYYEEYVEKFFQHTIYIAGAMDRLGGRAMWDEEDGFFYDVLRLPDGSATRLEVRSMVGLLPLAAVAVFEEDILSRMPRVRERMRTFIRRHRAVRRHPHAEPARRRRPPDGIDRQRAQAPPHPDAHARRASFSAPTAFARCPATTWSTRSSSTSVDRSTGWRTCPAIPTRACSAVTPTGAARYGCRSISCS